MNFSEAFKLMKQGAKIQLPSWEGYWYWSKEEQTIIIHTKDGTEMDIRETQCSDYTFSNVASEDWIVTAQLKCIGINDKGTISITGMEHFQSVCKKKLVEWYNVHEKEQINLSNVFVVWSCKALQNYKLLASITVSDDGIYAEYTYNGDKQELYEDVYKKVQNTCYKKE